MRIKPSMTPFISRKIVLDLIDCAMVRLVASEADCEAAIAAVLAAELAKEARLDARVDELMDEKMDEIELMQADEKALFWQIKCHLAEEFGVIMNLQERHQALAGAILAALIEADAINFSVNELRVRNVIFRAIEDYLRTFEIIDEAVYAQIKNHKRKLIPGSEEYEIVYQKLYNEELARRGQA